MPNIQLIERDMTPAELAQMNAGFDLHASQHGNPPVPSKRYGYVLMDGESFIGCASGLTNDNYEWFYLTDLFIEETYRGQGLGAKILNKLEERLIEIGVKHIWTWTAGYEAPGFYKKQGYSAFVEMPNWYVCQWPRPGRVMEETGGLKRKKPCSLKETTRLLLLRF